jgi:hypothetical protein
LFRLLGSISIGKTREDGGEEGESGNVCFARGVVNLRSSKSRGWIVSQVVDIQKATMTSKVGKDRRHAARQGVLESSGLFCGTRKMEMGNRGERFRMPEVSTLFHVFMQSPSPVTILYRYILYV